MSYFARLAGRAQVAPTITPVLASSSPLVAFDQRLNQPGFAELAPVAVEAPGVPLAWADAARVGAGEAPTDPFESSPSAENVLEPARSVAAPELGVVPVGAPLVSELETVRARAPRPSASFPEARESAPPAASPVETFVRAWPRTEAKAVASPAPLPPSVGASSPFEAARPGAALNEARPNAEHGSMRAAVESSQRASRQELEPLGREPEPSVPRGTLPASVATDARFPANLRDALAQVEAWMSQGTNEPRASSSAATPGSAPRPTAGSDLSSALSAGSAERMHERAPRLSIGHIEVEVVTSEPAPQAPMWPVPQRAPVAPSAPSSRHRGRLGFGMRQG